MKTVIYGSYGYTGNLIAELAANTDSDILLSGRNGRKLEEQGERLKLPWKVASLEQEDELDSILKDAEIVIHCAGPFVHTWRPMMEACIRNRTHYMDITGEIEVFEGAAAMDSRLKEAGIMAMPGTGFDVVPTDCMAAFLKKELPDATHLELAFRGVGSAVSHGTAKTMIENLGSGGAIRRNGEIMAVPSAYRTREIEIEGKYVHFVSIPWGDVSTAYHSTGIRNIIVYTAMPPKTAERMKWLYRLRFLFKMKWVKNWMKKKVDERPPGPDEDQRKNGRTIVWGEARNGDGRTVQAVLETPEAYRLTAETAWLIRDRIASGEYIIGFGTPSSVYGDQLILKIDHTKRTMKENNSRG
ncbi:MAG: saccharopine dehydrogenase NADP-binding domain-containing protein [Balneolaceae bacterium]|nr:saccharopine dehydrogenase NADP-binding domain-containing protein [Balneolaceae bacterium]MCH8548837.1 saccharopine dehydrogenase NADP-binding domain-containing protein [Balneolaceae bacterium]